MNIKYIGYALIIIGLMQISLGYIARGEINTLKLSFMPPTCHEENDPDTCPVLRNNVDWYIAFIWLLSAATIAGGAYLAFLHKDTQKIHAQNKALISKISKISRETEGEKRFEILLKGLDKSEQKILREVNAQDGIGQNTLCIRTGLSKTKLSLLLTDLEKRNLVKKVPDGKINRIYLKQAV
ncbi:MAG: hypothetical protein ABIH83_05130 [Candidatus Micrarchaeota archaeon]